MDQFELPGLAGPEGASTEVIIQPRSQRLRVLIEKHNKLLQQIARKREAIETLELDIRKAGSVAADVCAPLMQEGLRIEQEIHRLFAELLQRKGPARVRSQIRAVYQMVQLSGRLSRPPESARGTPPPRDAGGPMDGPGEGDGQSPHGGENRRVAPDNRGGPVVARAEMRRLFHRLAGAVHPDRAQNDADRADFTRSMQEISAAYSAGDFARLVEIEQSIATRAIPTHASSAPTLVQDEERRCEELVSTCATLRLQLRRLESQLRDLRRSPAADLVRAGERFGGDPVKMAVGFKQEIEDDLASLADLGAFVRSFHEGRIDLDTFLAGPSPLSNDEEDGVGDDFLDFLNSVDVDALVDVLATVASPPPVRGGGGRSKKRGKQGKQGRGRKR